MSGPPYLDIEFSKLNTAQRRAREEWMAREADRLIAAKGGVKFPTRGQVNQVAQPSNGPSADELHNQGMALQLIEAMARRDRSNWNGR